MALVGNARRNSQIVWKRTLSYYKNTNKKRFYKNVELHSAEDGFHIKLDSRTVKTPLLNQLYVPSKPLALAVLNEWNMQTAEINKESMPLTKLCNTVIDNATDMSNDELIDEMLNFAHTDTVCSLAEEPESLVLLQKEKWKPVTDWFSQRYKVNVNSSANIFQLFQSDETISSLKRHLMRLNRWQLIGLQSAVESIKSFILPMVVIDDHLSVEEAVYLSRLEVEFQIEKWGNVEFAHELDKHNQTASLAAGVLFYQLT